MKTLLKSLFHHFNTTDVLYEKIDLQPLYSPQFNPPKMIFLVRHGEHEGNVDETLFYSKPDWKMELTEEGRESCRKVANEIYDIIEEEERLATSYGEVKEESVLVQQPPFDIKWFVSPYIRCQETYRLIADECFGGHMEQNWREEIRLREQEWGNYQDESWKDRMMERIEFGRFFYRFPNGESGCDVFDRVGSFLEELFSREFQKRDCSDYFVFISHGFTLRMFLARYFRWTVEEFEYVWNFEPSEFVILKRFGETKEDYHYKILNEIASFNTNNKEEERNNQEDIIKGFKRTFLNWNCDDYITTTK